MDLLFAKEKNVFSFLEQHLMRSEGLMYLARISTHAMNMP